MSLMANWMVNDFKGTLFKVHVDLFFEFHAQVNLIDTHI
ncbi:hypothetical protein DSUL_50193 [Desulfovibrionales bacterium]